VRDVVILFLDLIVTVARLAFVPSSPRRFFSNISCLILNRGRKRAPNLRATDRILAGLWTLFIRRTRVLRSAITLRLRRAAGNAGFEPMAEGNAGTFGIVELPVHPYPMQLFDARP
jgi:hypothetical protein